MSVVGVVFLFIPSRAIIIPTTVGLIFSPTVFPNSSPPFKLTASCSSPEVVRQSNITLPQWEAGGCCSLRFHYADRVGCYVDCVDYVDYDGCYQHSQLCSHSDSLSHSPCIGMIADPTVGANISNLFPEVV